MGYIEIDKQIPQKGKDIIAIDSEGIKHNCFRCNCSLANCNEYRCSITGYLLIFKIVKWEYVN